MAQAAHQAVGLHITFAAGVGLEPFPKGGIKRFVLGHGDWTSLFDEVSVSAESDIFHENSVHENGVTNNKGSMDSAAHADEGHEAAALGGFFAVAEEEIAAAGGAEVADGDVWGAETDGEELCAIGFAKVEQDVLGRGLVAGGHHVEPLDGIGFVAGAEFVEPFGSFGKLGEELGGDFGADFVATASDGGADGGEEVGRVGFELHLHFADGFDDNAGESAAPAGVDGGDGTFLGVYEENRDAVGSLHAEEEAGTVGDGGIAVARVGGATACVEKVDCVGVDLFQGDEF